MIDAGRRLADTFGVAFLIKGGHLQGDGLSDVLVRPGVGPRVFASRRIHGVNTHGSGCTLSAAIAANLARGSELDAAVGAAQAYLLRGMEHSLKVGGQRFIRHST